MNTCKPSLFISTVRSYVVKGENPSNIFKPARKKTATSCAEDEQLLFKATAANIKAGSLLWGKLAPLSTPKDIQRRHITQPK